MRCSAKTTLIALSILFAIGGLCEICASIKTEYRDKSKIPLFIRGTFHLVTSVFACYATLHDKPTWIKIYAGISIFIFICGCFGIIKLPFDYTPVKATLEEILGRNLSKTEAHNLHVLYTVKTISIRIDCVFMSFLILALTQWAIIAAFSTVNSIEKSSQISFRKTPRKSPPRSTRKSSGSIV